MLSSRRKTETGNIKLFLSCHEDDLEPVRRLYHTLKKWNIDPWMAQEDILPGENKKAAFRKAVGEADFFFACISSRTVNQRGNHQKYIKKALDLFMEKLDDDIYFIPVCLDGCDIPASFERFEPVYITEPGGDEKLMRALHAGAEKYGLTLRKQSETLNPEAGSGNRVSESSVWPFQTRNKDHARYFIEIDPENGVYTGMIHQGDREKAYSCGTLRLAPDDAVKIRDRRVSWRNIVEAIIDFDGEFLPAWLDDRGQYEIGKALFEAVFGNRKLCDIQPATGEMDIRIIAGDEHIARLPWPLLANRGIFLSTAGWSAAISTDHQVRNARIPSKPKILMVAPQAKDQRDKGAADLAPLE